LDWSINGGAVKGMAQRMGRRLKWAGPEWCVDHVEGMAMLITANDYAKMVEPLKPLVIHIFINLNHLKYAELINSRSP
jgi:hypothetical protein